MTIILFLVDTSSSMCQKAYVNGVQKSYLDIAKGAVETFLKFRQRTQDCLGDRYMLLTFEEPPANVKAGWKENHATFMNELKNLQSNGLTSMGESLKNAFDLLNLNRMQSGIDTYGQGRCPFYLEPSVIIVITDGGKYSFRNGVHQDIILPLNSQIPGTKFTKEPFRWDQRLFSLVLRMSGNKIDERVDGKVPHDDSPIERMCEVTGGRSYRVKSHYVLNQCIESLVQKVQPGVVLHFDQMLLKDLKDGEVQDIAFQTTKKMIYVQKHISQKTFPVGFWPLPEPYWPDPKSATLPPRDAHPKLRIVTPCVDEPQMVRNFPVDKYEVEASPLTLQILSKREMNKCWPVIISNGMHGFEVPFGYLKASPNFAQVHLYVLAYNYPALLPLLHDLIHKYNMSPPNDLMYKFNAYVRLIPPYYCPFLRRALLNINVPYPLLQFLLPENADNYLSPNIANQLKHIKNTAKQDQENLCQKVLRQLRQPRPPYWQIERARLIVGPPMRRDLVRNPLLRDTFSKLHSEIEPIENYTIVVPSMVRQPPAKNYRNPFDIPRRDLIDEISKMRDNFLRSSTANGIGLVNKDSGHCLPISEMGNYQEYLKNKDNPLREIEPTNVRQHMFGNPYKKDKHMVMVDEADLGEVAPIKSPNAQNAQSKKQLELGSRSRKRKAGPIRRDFIFRRTSTDSRPSTPSIASSTSSCKGGFDSDTDDSMSDTSSVISSDDGDPDRLSSFEFNEPLDEFPINGHVRNFINGVTDDIEEGVSGTVPVHLSTPSHLIMQGNHSSNTIVSNNSLTSALGGVLASSSGVSIIGNGIPNNNIHIPNPYTSPIFVEAATSLSAVASHPHHHHPFTAVAAQSVGVSPVLASVAAVSSIAGATLQPTPAATTNGHNDINSDAQEISRILQQCHNGSSSSCGVVVPTSSETFINKHEIMIADSLPVDFDSSKPLEVEADQKPGVSSAAYTTNSNFDSLKKESPASSAEPLLTIEQRDAIRRHNIELRATIFRDIRRPGRNYSQLLENLNQMKGDIDTKNKFIQMCVTESKRFRRQLMANSIQDWWDKRVNNNSFLMQNPAMSSS
ncbi:integrator complex subunit 6 [Episyrphus balteatus]|uniref:integrator complex subunit 6 n=1 Tax=Episyrphus balteatus TaxID=286459 RepID=UPI0024851939|nr:integrator complex subunit 6 [Episyrphus balteatus]XP_055845301.1 integrator complex subunit 6 [Episyrphus balteatus]